MICFFRMGKCEDKYKDAFRAALKDGVNTKVEDLKKAVDNKIGEDYNYIDGCWKDSSPQATAQQNAAPGLQKFKDNLLSPILLANNFNGSKKSKRRRNKAIKKAAEQLCYLLQAVYNGQYAANLKFP